MLRAFLALLPTTFFGLLVLGCEAPPTSPSETRVRIRNASTTGFDRVVVGFPEQQETYGALSAGSASAYRTVALAYRYAYVKVEANGEERVLQPIDYVGEEPLGAGRFTYVLSWTEDHLQLELTHP